LPVDSNIQLKSVLKQPSGPHPDILLLKLLCHVTLSYTYSSLKTASSSDTSTKIFVLVSVFPLPGTSHS